MLTTLVVAVLGTLTVLVLFWVLVQLFSLWQQSVVPLVPRCHLCDQYNLSLQEEEYLHQRIEQLHRTHPTRQRGFASLSTSGRARLPSE